MKIIPVKLKNNPYNIHIGRNCLSRISLYAQKNNLGNLGIVIVPHSVYQLYKKYINSTFRPKSTYKIIKVKDGESLKSRYWLFKVIKQILEYDKLNKRIFLICLGGGTVGDLGGFIASIYKRGIPYIQAPTTLLAQIDSSIGGKTAIDLKEAKNIVGSIYQPKAVFTDPSFLSTLPAKEFNQGMAEAIKYGIIKDRKLFAFLKNRGEEIKKKRKSSLLELIATCSAIKAVIVSTDEKEERGIRTILNFGHTFAHALESAQKYKNISHGEAVSIGMVFAAFLSCNLGKCRKKIIGDICEVLKIYGLPTGI
ncbi:MAG: 3-dehydroquinate synthase, partial [Candidatus Omnitrophica bacterium]|nr:3-dehydroquinate synthase [Candidatus Omnitrophota bacterium]MBD3269876.1 3-dehydroquinate synthase [Candidatus Omnitrophota bacterium]